MSTELLDELRRREIRVWTDGDRLRCSAPPGRLTPRLRARIAAAKAELLELLASFEPTDETAGEAAPPAIGRAEGPREGAEGWPLSFSQERLWFLDQMEATGAAYTVPTVLRLDGTLEIARLKRALTALAERHEVLRTTFRAVDGTPRQVIGAVPDRLLRNLDLTRLDDDAANLEVGRQVAQEVARPFDLAAGPLLRVLLMHRAPAVHILVVSLHHIVTDGWSMEILVRELTALYGGRDLPALPVQYADFAVWQRRQLTNAGLERQLAYWRRQLAGAPALLELPADRPRPAVKRFQGAVRAGWLDARLSEDLGELARGEEATLFMALLASWSALLARLSGQPDVVIGSPIAGRPRTEVEGLIGCFVNTLVLRTDVAGDPSFRQLVGRARRTALEAYAHQDLPFERLVDGLRVERAVDRTPIFQVVLTLQNTLPGAAELAELRLALLEVPTRTAKFDLTLVLTATDPRLGIAVEYDTHLFDATTIDRWLGHYQILGAAGTAAPDEGLSCLPLLAPAQIQQLTVEWNDGEPPGRPVSLLRRFERQAARQSDALAVGMGGRWLSYAELDARADRLARRLRRRGVGPDTLVGICLGRTPRLLVALLAVWKAGGGYVPIDPDLPDERLAFLLDDALGEQATPRVVTEEAFADRLPAGFAAVRVDEGVRVDTEAEADAADGPLPGPVVPDATAYVIYTSGSTGRPKGVVVSHRNVARLLSATETRYGFGVGDVWTLFHSFAFDFSVWEIWGALAYGGRLVVVPYLVSRSPAVFAELLAREAVTVLNQTPSAFRALVDLRQEPLPTLRWVIFGGEALPLASLEPWFEKYGGFESYRDGRLRLVNMYGITETTVHVTWRPIDPADLAPGPRSPIGRAIADLELHVLDAGGRPLPPGVTGELFVGGAGLARGYWRRAALTAERFLPDPFTGSWAVRRGARLYRTGDLGRRLASGELDYVGRWDHQVKVRGFRVELGEIEAALAEQPEVRGAVVLARGDGERRRLVAHLVSAGEAPLPELRRRLAARLPDPMVPSAWVVHDALPRLPGGKVDRRALARDAANEASAAATTLTAARNRTELELARIWEELLEMGPVSIDVSFFDQGGHSLLAVRMLARVRERCGVDLPLAALFQAPTIAELAELLEAGPAPALLGPLVALRAAGRRPPLFCVHPVGGGVLCYQRLVHHLARELGGEQPVYGLQARGWDGDAAPRTRVETMARDYLTALREVRPSGPYCLGGWSTGGLVAWEMARQLDDAGERVALLALIDTRTPGALWGKEGSRLDDAALLALYAHEVGLPVGDDPRWERVVELAVAARRLPQEDAPRALRRILEVHRANLEASHSYTPRPWDGRVLLLRAAEPLAGESLDGDPSYGWSRLSTSSLAVEPVPGDHFTLIEEPRVAELAAVLARTLIDAVSAEESPT